MGYSTQFLALETISPARDPGYMNIGKSSKLVDFVISDRFRGQLHIVFLGSGTISTARDPCYMKIGTSSKLIDLVIFGHFRGL